jgi:hypothetical protein
MLYFGDQLKPVLFFFFFFFFFFWENFCNLAREKKGGDVQRDFFGGKNGPKLSHYEGGTNLKSPQF